jgi:hypothetical protein
MGADCCDHCDMADPHRGNPAYRRVLWAVLAMPIIEGANIKGKQLARRERFGKETP